MATGAKKPAAAAAPTTAAATANARQRQRQRQQQSLFEAKHAELLSEARGVAREIAVDVCAIAFRPDGTAARHEFLGVGREARVEDLVRRAGARDLSAMGPEEVSAHGKQLQRLRAALVGRDRELQAKAGKAKATARSKRSPEQQEMAAGNTGSSDKIRIE